MAEVMAGAVMVVEEQVVVESEAAVRAVVGSATEVVATVEEEGSEHAECADGAGDEGDVGGAYAVCASAVSGSAGCASGMGH